MEVVELEEFKKCRPHIKVGHLKNGDCRQFVKQRYQICCWGYNCQRSNCEGDEERTYSVLEKLVNKRIVEIVKDRTKVIEAFP